MIELLAVACILPPIAMALEAEAIADLPIAIVSVADAIDKIPKAIDFVPVD
jgi:hypothetical protein